MGSRHIPTSRLFKSSQYRLYKPNDFDRLDYPYISFYTKRSTAGERTVYARSKAGFIKGASIKCHIEYRVFDELNEDLDSTFLNAADELNYFDLLPREVILCILKHLDAPDISNFARTCHDARVISYDNLLWKNICFNTWSDPNFFMINLEVLARNLRKWLNKISGSGIGTVLALDIYKKNIWRLIYIALDTLDLIPSISIGRTLLAERSIECFPGTRSFPYTSTVGSFKLVGVRRVSRIEYTVHSCVIKPWHRKECVETRPLPIYDLRSYGLKLARTVRGQHNIGFFNRRGYYLKTDLNRKIHLSYRYFPTLRFRLYGQQDKIFLLCKDLVINTGVTSDCYTMYEVIKTGEAATFPGVTSSADNNTKDEVDDNDDGDEEEQEDGGGVGEEEGTYLSKERYIEREGESSTEVEDYDGEVVGRNEEEENTQHEEQDETEGYEDTSEERDLDLGLGERQDLLQGEIEEETNSEADVGINVDEINMSQNPL